MKHHEIISQLTLIEKAALLSGKSTWESRDIPRLGISSLFCADGPHGVRKQLGATDHLGLNESQKSTCFPVAATMANSWDTELAETVGAALGTEAAALGVDVLLGPGLNIKRSPLCGRNFEYFSEDPYLSGKMAAAYIRGIQSKGVAACPKHFAVNNQELGRMVNDSVLDERTLREIYLTGFEIAVKEGNPKAIMTSYNLVNGTYANENTHLLVDILRDEWNFEGMVVTDWGGSNDHLAGVRAASTLKMPGPVTDSIGILVDAVQKGELEEAVLDARVDELLSVAMGKGRESKAFDAAQHHELAQKAAENSIVLLKNEDHILPLNPKTKVAIVGDFAQTPRYQGAGSSMVNPTRLHNTIEASHNSDFCLVGYATGFERLGQANEEMKKSAAEMAGLADVVLLYLGLNEVCEVEGMDRTTLDIPQNQIDLLHALYEVTPNIVVILSSGCVVDMRWADKCKGILHGYLSGQAGAQAILNVITGRVNPSGKLNESYPVLLSDTPAYKYFPGTEKTTEYREGLYVGYRYYATAQIPTAFPFGHGLSYTRFEYSSLRLNSDKAIISIKNTGERAGAEIVQLYISHEDAQVFRPARELKGFAKVFLKAGESKDVTLPLDDKAFRYYNNMTKRWSVEPGVYVVQVGSSSECIECSAKIRVDGDSDPNPYRYCGIDTYLSGNIQSVSDIEFETLLGHIIPEKHWSGEIDRNATISQMKQAKGWVGRLAYRILTGRQRKMEAKGTPDLNILFIYNMPLRSIAEMAGEYVSHEMVDGMVMVANGGFFRGVGKIIAGFFRHRRQSRRMVRELLGLQAEAAKGGKAGG